MFNFKSREFNAIGRSMVLSKHAMVVSSHPMAASLGIDVLRNGGLKVSENGSVINIDNKPIKGLFACGELIVGVFF